MVLLQGIVFGRALLEALSRRDAQRAFVSAPRLMATTSQQKRAHRKRERRTPHVNPFLVGECLHRLGGNSIRPFSTRRQPTLREVLKDETWVAVYRFPGIRIGVLLARAKLLQTIASVMLVPYTYWQYLNEVASVHFLGGVTVLATVATSMLILFSRYFNRMIGVISMSESNQFVRIGYLSFWGARRNKVLELGDALPLAEANDNLNDAVVKFRQFSTSSFLYLPISNVEIVDKRRATLLFGDLSIFNRSKKND
ncbi:Transmembrane protein [Toxocara canis]|uniref:Transmembrane protein 186 n=2 Tax=Toxocara canis TaxID=6265 RepID=A0A0B2V4E1_TOXCA|nr:Transmembrane protein [Toxocara canis]VDM49176.1 unnamed protein product [Toxocara canis]